MRRILWFHSSAGACRLEPGGGVGYFCSITYLLCDCQIHPRHFASTAFGNWHASKFRISLLIRTPAGVARHSGKKQEGRRLSACMTHRCVLSALLPVASVPSLTALRSRVRVLLLPLTSGTRLLPPSATLLLLHPGLLRLAAPLSPSLPLLGASGGEERGLALAPSEGGRSTRSMRAAAPPRGRW